nr:cytochrome c oxidase subunit 3 [Fulicoffula longipila]
MTKNGFHPFHIVDSNPWPILGSLALYSLMGSVFLLMKGCLEFFYVLTSIMSILLVSFQWWRDVIRESTFQGNHSKSVCWGLYMGIMMFIASEVMFFFSFFFGYFFTALSSDLELGLTWPPVGIEPLSFSQVPLMNTLILLSSGVSITWSHHALINSNLNQSKVGLIFTLILSAVFMYIQFEEYFECSFSMADSVFGSLFFITTGFHGVHVFVGSVFILTSMIRMFKLHFSMKHHIGYEASAWYWHFVDVVWLFLFLSIYWWGS